jgi:hypothetical protein
MHSEDPKSTAIHRIMLGNERYEGAPEPLTPEARRRLLGSANEYFVTVLRELELAANFLRIALAKLDEYEAAEEEKCQEKNPPQTTGT